MGGQTPDAAVADLRSLLLRGLGFALASYDVTDQDLEDFAQDGLLKILQELPTYRGEARFTTWAQKVCVRTALTELRRRRWRDVSLEDLVAVGVTAAHMDVVPTALVDTSTDPGRTAPTNMMMAMLQQIVDEELTDLQRTAMLAVMQGGMPLQEVADRMGTSRNALYKLLHDARRRIQQRLLAGGLSPQDLLAMFAEA